MPQLTPQLTRRRLVLGGGGAAALLAVAVIVVAVWYFVLRGDAPPPVALEQAVAVAATSEAEADADAAPAEQAADVETEAEARNRRSRRNKKETQNSRTRQARRTLRRPRPRRRRNRTPRRRRRRRRRRTTPPTPPPPTPASSAVGRWSPTDRPSPATASRRNCADRRRDGRGTLDGAERVARLRRRRDHGGRHRVDLTALTSDDSRRDGALRRQALETNTYPTTTFTLTEPIPIDAVPAEGVALSVTATGDLTLHGVTREVQIPMEGQLVGDRVAVVGSLEIVFADYDMDTPSAFIVLAIDDHGIMEFQLVFELEIVDDFADLVLPAIQRSCGNRNRSAACSIVSCRDTRLGLACRAKTVVGSSSSTSHGAQRLHRAGDRRPRHHGVLPARLRATRDRRRDIVSRGRPRRAGAQRQPCARLALHELVVRQALRRNRARQALQIFIRRTTAEYSGPFNPKAQGSIPGLGLTGPPNSAKLDGRQYRGRSPRLPIAYYLYARANPFLQQIPEGWLAGACSSPSGVVGWIPS